MLSAEPRWIEFDEAIEFHDWIIEHQVGRPGFPFPGYLDSALHAPKQHYHYSDGGCDLFDLAAVYLYHVGKSHAFTDGNKRTAYISTLVFLGLNGIDVSLPPNRLILARAAVDAVADELTKEQIADVLREMPARRMPPAKPPRPGTRRYRKQHDKPPGKKMRRGKRNTRKRLL